MAHHFYICDSVFREHEIKVYYLDDSSTVQGVRTNAITQMAPQAMRGLLNSMVKTLGASDYKLYAILIVGSNQNILGYECIVYDPELALQFKLAYC